MVLYALLAVVMNLIPWWYTELQETLGIWGLVAWATVGAGLLVAWYGGVIPGRLNLWLQIAVRAVSWFAVGVLCVRLFDFRLTADSVQLSVSNDLPWIAFMLALIVVGFSSVVHPLQRYIRES